MKKMTIEYHLSSERKPISRTLHLLSLIVVILFTYSIFTSKVGAAEAESDELYFEKNTSENLEQTEDNDLEELPSTDEQDGDNTTHGKEESDVVDAEVEDKTTKENDETESADEESNLDGEIDNDESIDESLEDIGDEVSDEDIGQKEKCLKEECLDSEDKSSSISVQEDISDKKTKQISNKKSNKNSSLQNGDENKEVVHLKKDLTKLGFGNYPENPSEKFGNSTERNVREFQQYYGLKVSGIADKTTLQFIQDTLNSIYQNGKSGKHVVTLKKNLSKLGFGNYPVNPSEKFGGSTDRNVREFQQYYGLKVNGIADKTTLQFIQDTLDSIYQNGNSGKHVVTLKKNLSKLGFGNYPTNPSQKFGASTDRNVRKFQQYYGLKVNGIADKTTLQFIQDTLDSIYQNGNSGKHVVTLKKNLSKLGFGNYPSNPSQKFGASTDRNVREFQQYYGLKVNGIADKATLEFIQETLDSIYQNGNSGMHVVTLKKNLSKLGFGNYPTNPSKNFGGSTEKNIKEFQKHFNLKVNGIADKVTLDKIDALVKQGFKKGIKIFIDAGHGGSDSGAVSGGLKEKDLTLYIAKKIQEYLGAYKNVVIKMSRTNDKTLSLSDRTKMANDWGADFFFSVHINAGGGTGIESYIHNKNYTKEEIEFQNIIHSHIANGLKSDNVRDRGKKKANFHVVRETKMSAMLFEYLFIDNKTDQAKLKSNSFLNKLGKLTAEAIARAFNLRK